MAKIARLLLLIVAAAVLTMSSTSCNLVPFLSYKTYKSDVEGFRVSFEYPRSWDARQIVSGGPGVAISMSNASSGFVSSQPTKANGGEFANPAELAEHVSSTQSNVPELKVLSRGKASLGSVEGEELTVSYRFHVESPQDFLPTGKVIDRRLVESDLAVEHNGRIY